MEKIKSTFGSSALGSRKNHQLQYHDEQPTTLLLSGNSGGGDHQVAAGRTVAAHGHRAMCGSSRLLLVVEAVSDNSKAMRRLVIVLTLPASTGTAKGEVGSVVGGRVGRRQWLPHRGVIGGHHHVSPPERALS
eukprot:scaffold55810_cov40-Attheya_sp.AAC.1